LSSAAPVTKDGPATRRVNTSPMTSKTALFIRSSF
jgi:hypothetical protein